MDLFLLYIPYLFFILSFLNLEIAKSIICSFQFLYIFLSITFGRIAVTLIKIKANPHWSILEIVLYILFNRVPNAIYFGSVFLIDAFPRNIWSFYRKEYFFIHCLS